jgi:Uncharacterised nucleotidyltransferase
LVGALEQVQLLELLKSSSDGRRRGAGVHRKRLDELVRDVLWRGPAIAAFPDEAGRPIELMNQIGPAVEHHDLALDGAGPHVGPASGNVRHRAAIIYWWCVGVNSDISWLPMQSIIRLLRAVAHDRDDVALDQFPERQIGWLLDSGLGPTLRRHLADSPNTRALPAWSLVQGADLAGRMVTADYLDAMEHIVRACAGRIQPPTLLKGISICGQFYPEPHLRPMGDIDVLVAMDDLPTVESALLELGYRRESISPPEFYATHHHTTPFRHPHTGVWVEVHRGLCPSSSPIASDALFGLESVRSEQQVAEFRGHAVYRLSPELQIVYLAAHWAYNIRPTRGLVTMLDAIYLLKSARAMRWERILSWLDGAAAATPLCLLLTYLDRHELIELPVGLIDEISGRERALGPVSRRVLHAMIDRYLVDGCEMGLLMSDRSFTIFWRNLLRPRHELAKVPLIVWNLAPSRRWLRRWAPAPRRRSKGPQVSD